MGDLNRFLFRTECKLKNLSNEIVEKMKEKIIFIVFLTILILTLSLGGCIESNDEINGFLSFTTSEGLQGYWNFEEEIEWNESEPMVLDISENEHHGIANGTIHNKSGKIGNLS